MGKKNLALVIPSLVHSLGRQQTLIRNAANVTKVVRPSTSADYTMLFDFFPWIQPLLHEQNHCLEINWTKLTLTIMSFGSNPVLICFNPQWNWETQRTLVAAHVTLKSDSKPDVQLLKPIPECCREILLVQTLTSSFWKGISDFCQRWKWAMPRKYAFRNAGNHSHIRTTLQETKLYINCVHLWNI